jgi:hypothetical protein
MKEYGTGELKLHMFITLELDDLRPPSLYALTKTWWSADLVKALWSRGNSVSPARNPLNWVLLSWTTILRQTLKRCQQEYPNSGPLPPVFGVWSRCGCQCRATAVTNGRLYAVRKWGHCVLGSVGMGKCVPNCKDKNTYCKPTGRVADKLSACMEPQGLRLQKSQSVDCTLRQMNLLHTLIPLCSPTYTRLAHRNPWI